MYEPCFASSFLPSSLVHQRPARTRVCTVRATAAVAAPAMTAFRKYHGLGNDFVLIDNRDSETPALGAEAAAAVCDRHTGVGADGVIFMLPAATEGSDFAMRLFNSDGSEPEMCGNGIRCLARFAADLGVRGQAPGTFRVDTGAGLIVPELLDDGTVRVDMGEPMLSPCYIPTTLQCTLENSYVAPMTVNDRDWPTTAVSMGNPHAVIFVNEEDYAKLDRDLETIGPEFETNHTFPAKTNTEFVRILAPDRLRMLVWERGAGRTRACGTGACAVVVAAVLTEHVARGKDVTVELPGGDLVISWADDDHVFMTGPAQLVYSGELAGDV